MSSILLPSLFHAACCVVNAYHWLTIPDMPEITRFYHHAQWLTMWGLIAEGIYFGLALLADVVALYQYLALPPTPQQRKQNKRLSVFFRAVCFPLGAVVALLFWSIYHYEREYIYPLYFEQNILPPHMNHIQHTFPLFALLVDMLIVDHGYEPESLKSDQFIIGSVSVTYLMLLLYIRLAYKRWVYGFLGALPLFGKVIFICTAILLCQLGYMGGRMVSESVIWKKAKKRVKRTVKEAVKAKVT